MHAVADVTGTANAATSVIVPTGNAKSALVSIIPSGAKSAVAAVVSRLTATSATDPTLVAHRLWSANTTADAYPNYVAIGRGCGGQSTNALVIGLVPVTPPPAIKVEVPALGTGITCRIVVEMED